MGWQTLCHNAPLHYCEIHLTLDHKLGPLFLFLREEKKRENGSLTRLKL